MSIPPLSRGGALAHNPLPATAASPFPMTKEEIQQLIEAGLPGAQVRVTGDDGRHFEAEVVCAAFAGKMPVAQHRMVYATLGDRMGREIHALQLTTRAAP